MTRKIRCGGKAMTVIVLAGGRGRRMKADKAALPVRDGTLLDHVIGQVGPLFDEVLVSVSPGQEIDLGEREEAKVPVSGRGKAGSGQVGVSARKENRVRVRVVRDETPGQGPMAGIAAGLRAAGNDACAVVACDIPEVDADLLRELARAAADAQIAVPVSRDGDFEPLFAVYRTSVLPRIERLLRMGERSLIPLFGLCRTARLRLGDTARLRNLNTRGDYEEYLRWLKLKAGKSRLDSSGRTGRRKGTGR